MKVNFFRPDTTRQWKIHLRQLRGDAERNYFAFGFFEALFHLFWPLTRRRRRWWVCVYNQRLSNTQMAVAVEERGKRRQDARDAQFWQGFALFLFFSAAFFLLRPFPPSSSFADFLINCYSKSQVNRSAVCATQASRFAVGRLLDDFVSLCVLLN